jgi:hypothetical protein
VTWYVDSVLRKLHPDGAEAALCHDAVIAGVGLNAQLGDWEFSFFAPQDAERSLDLMFPNGFTWRQTLGPAQKRPEDLRALVDKRVVIAGKLDATAGILREQSAGPHTAYSATFDLSEEDLHFTAAYERWLREHPGAKQNPRLKLAVPEARP